MSVRIPELASWTSCNDCTGGPEPGARALLAYWLEAETLASSMGIYACRTVRGSGSRSIHSCGRAVDCGVPTSAAGRQAMYRFLEALAPHAKRLGIQCIIFDRTIWSAVRAPEGERYGGAHPHDDHAHIELTPEAASRLTLATLRAVAGDLRSEGSSTPDPEPEPEPEPDGGFGRSALVDALPTLDLGDDRQDAEVTTVQHLLAARSTPPSRTFDGGRADGYSGTGTRQALAAFQRRTRTGDGANPDLIVGPKTWTALLGTVKTIRFDKGTIRGSVVKTVQALLAARGHVPDRTIGADGQPDGVGGPGTQQALAGFQESTGSGAADGTADLIVGPKTWRALTRTG